MTVMIWIRAWRLGVRIPEQAIDLSLQTFIPLLGTAQDSNSGSIGVSGTKAAGA